MIQMKNTEKFTNIDEITITRLIDTTMKESIKMLGSQIPHSFAIGFDGCTLVMNIILYPLNDLSRISMRCEIDTINHICVVSKPESYGIIENKDSNDVCKHLFEMWSVQLEKTNCA